MQDQRFDVRLAATQEDLRAAQRLRYEVFVEELGADCPAEDRAERLERDRFDQHFDHAILVDLERDGAVVGAYRVLRDDQAAAAGQFYSEDEYDLGALRGSGRRLMELGRSCLAPEYRSGPGMFLLWNWLAGYVIEHGVEILFGVASFHGTDPAALAQPLSMLHHRHLAPEDLRVRAREESYQDMALLPESALDARKATLELPALIKGYLRLGGKVGDGAFIDRAFNTTDVCLVLDTARMSEAHKRLYAGASA